MLNADACVTVKLDATTVGEQSVSLLADLRRFMHIDSNILLQGEQHRGRQHQQSGQRLLPTRASRSDLLEGAPQVLVTLVFLAVAL